MTHRRGPRPAPDRIGPYEVLRELGRGGMGVVYLARDPRLERQVAIKTLSAELSRDEEWSARFSREARLLASLNHPNIATIFSLEREGDRVFLTMELIPGQSLEAMVRSGPLPVADALSIGRQIARGLEAAHSAGVIHRDLKPLNVMVTPESHVKLLDFGLATRAAAGGSSGNGSGAGRAVASAGGAGDAGEDPRAAGDSGAAHSAQSQDDATVAVSDPSQGSAGSNDSRTPGSGSGPRRVTATTGAGTPGYMSPEQVRGEDLDARTDLWALGCVLFESLCGRRAFGGSSAQERIRSTLRGAVNLEELPPRTPDSVRELIRACLQLAPPARPRSAAEARECLEAALAQRAWEPLAGGARPASEDIEGQASRPHNLPHELNPLIGRAREKAQVGERLAHNRLVTLTGVGGGGKTRLALSVGWDLRGRFPDGVWLVELAPVAESAGILRAAAGSLGVAESAGQPLGAALAAHLSRRSLLLILDNCEHLVQASAEFAGGLLAASPELRILATSREALGLPGESVFPVPPLEVPPAPTPASGAGLGSPGSLEALSAAESVQLFAQRAAQVRSDFRLSAENIEEVAEICRRLEGIPLAVELAAARIKALSLAEIGRRLDDRFRLLKGTSRAVLPHHQTLEAMIDWSHASLTEGEQRLFRRLSLFRGGWTLDAADAVCPDSALAEWEVLDVLTRLIDKSLVLFVPGGSTGTPEPRYRMLETIREYAFARLQSSEDAAAVEARFVGYFAALAEAAAQNLTGPAQAEWLARLDAETDNIRAATRSALDGDDPSLALRLTGQMLRYWMIRARWREGRAALEQAIARPGAEAHPAPLAAALNGLGSCCYQLNDLDAAAECYQRAVSLFHETLERRRAGPPLINLGNVHRMRGDFDQAVASLTAALDCLEESDQWMIGAIQMNLGSIALMREQYDEARLRGETAMGIYRALGDRVHTAMSGMNLGLIAYRRGRLPEARSLLEESAASFEELGDRNFGSNAQVNLGIVLLATGALAEASGVFAKALRTLRETGNLENVAACLEGFMQIALARGDLVRGARLAGAAESIRAKHGILRHAVDQREWDAAFRAFALQVGEENFNRLVAEGAALDPEAAASIGFEVAEAEG